MACPDMIVMPDVALDPYSIYGHDGIIANGDVENDSTNDALVKWQFLMRKQAPIL
jgi:porphobilinogen synthase